LRRHAESADCQRVPEFMRQDGDEDNDDPFDQKLERPSHDVSKQSHHHEEVRLNFYRHSEDFHFKLFRSILPRSFFGRASWKMTRRGYLCMASRPLTNSCSWRASSTLCANPSFSTTYAAVLVNPSSS